MISPSIKKSKIDEIQHLCELSIQKNGIQKDFITAGLCTLAVIQIGLTPELEEQFGLALKSKQDHKLAIIIVRINGKILKAQEDRRKRTVVLVN